MPPKSFVEELIEFFAVTGIRIIFFIGFCIAFVAALCVTLVVPPILAHYFFSSYLFPEPRVTYVYNWILTWICFVLATVNAYMYLLPPNIRDDD